MALTVKDEETGLTIGIPKDGKINHGSCTMQEVLIEKLSRDLDQFREAIKLIDGLRK